MAKDKEPVKVIFAPGCFDNFEGTQDELDALVKEITNYTPEELEAISKPVDLNELLDEDPEFAQLIIDQLNNIDTTPDRKLH